MTKAITQEARLDLTDEKIRAEKLAFSIELFKSLEAITRGKKVVIEKEVKDCILKVNCDLMAENERLKKQLKDYEKALKKYADPFYDKQPVNELAKRTLKKWEKK